MILVTYWGFSMAIILKNIPAITGVRARSYVTDTYTLVTSASMIDEGLRFTITINTTGLNNGTLVPYTITGVTSADINGAALTGNFVITDGADTIEFLASQDFLTEGPEYMTISLDNGRSSADLLINDTSTDRDAYWYTNTVLLMTGEGYGQLDPETIKDKSTNNATFARTGTSGYVNSTQSVYDRNWNITFGGTNAVSFTLHPSFNIGTNDASVEVFMRQTSSSTCSLFGQNSGIDSTIQAKISDVPGQGRRICATVNNDALDMVGPVPALNVWYHIVVTYSNGTARLFVDGVLYAVKTGIGSIISKTDPYTLGAKSWGGSGLIGQLSNFRFCNGSIPAEYQTTSTTIGSKIFGIPASNLPATQHTVLLTGQTPYLADLSTYRHTYVSNTASSLSGPMPIEEKFRSGVLTLNGATKLTNSGSNAFNFGTGAFTFETVFRLASMVKTDGTYDPIISSSPSTGGFQVYKNATSNAIHYGAFNVFGVEVVPESMVSLNQWIHLAIVRESTAANKTRVYVNGVLTKTYTDTQNYNVSGVEIGGYSNHNVAGWYLDGQLGPTRAVKGVALYNSNFMPELPTNIAGTSLLLDFGDTAVYDLSVAPQRIYKTWNITAATDIKKYGERSIKFNGNSRINLLYSGGLQLGASDFTIEFWLYNSGNTAGKVIINNGGGSYVAWGSYYVGFSAANNLVFDASFANTAFDISGNLGLVPTNQWIHVAITRSGSLFQGYVDGIRKWQTTNTGTLFDHGVRGLQIGAECLNTWDSAPANGFIGYIDDLRITKGVARYTSTTFAPPDRLPIK